MRADEPDGGPGDRATVLCLVDEIGPTGLDPDTRLLLHHLSAHVDIVLVAQCYLKASHRARSLPFTSELYGFPSDGYDENVAAFAARVVDSHTPDWVLAHGWANSQLVAALDRLDCAIVSYTDYFSAAPDAESQINRTFRHATAILFAEAAIPDCLTSARWGLDSRHYKILDAVASVVETRPRNVSWVTRLFGGNRPASGFDVSPTLWVAGRDAAARRRRSRQQGTIDRARIEASGLFDADLFLRPRETTDPGDPIAAYLRASELCVPRDRTFAGRLLRRPVPGFHPLIYAADNAAFDETTGEDPLAHYIRHGAPAGRWTHAVIRPQAETGPASIKAAIHAHLHYPDLLPELLERLGSNQSKLDLIITTTSDERLRDISAILDAAGITATRLDVCPNLGRDLWPFVELLQAGVFADYQVVGHFHGKRSPHYDLGDIWRTFLWTHLLGGPDRMTDVVLGAFASDPTIGLVFAEEPHLEGWEQNLKGATDLARGAGIATPLPNHFDYPMGTMFWARPAALAPLLALGLTPADIPPEPLPVDGTMLHALERLIPFFVEKAGYRYATTYVRGSRR